MFNITGMQNFQSNYILLDCPGHIECREPLLALKIPLVAHSIVIYIILFVKQFFVADDLFRQKEKHKAICDDLDSTFAELTGY